jgi:hypothetical protein
MGFLGMDELPLDAAPKLTPAAAAMYYSMRALPLFAFRQLVGHLAAKGVGLTRRQKNQQPGADGLGGVTDTLRRNGWAALPPMLSPEQVTEVLGFLKPRDLVAADGRRFRADNAPAGASLASYPLRTVLECPHIMQVMNRPDVLGVAEQYLGCQPTISGLRIDWSCPATGTGYVQRFHRDYDDWKIVKLFVYLSDVDDTSGPHEFVATSHRHSGQLRAIPYEQADLERTYGRERLVRVVGSRGTSFMVDTWGIHKGNVPMTRTRIMLQIQYSILPVLKFAYRPVRMPLPNQFNRYTNRLLVSS